MKLKPVMPRDMKVLAIWTVAVRAQGETTIHVPKSDFKPGLRNVTSEQGISVSKPQNDMKTDMADMVKNPKKI